MHMICLLTLGMTKWQIMMVWKDEMIAQAEKYGEVEAILGKISPVYNLRVFCDHLISTVNIATTYQNDIDECIRRAHNFKCHIYKLLNIFFWKFSVNFLDHFI